MLTDTHWASFRLLPQAWLPPVLCSSRHLVFHGGPCGQEASGQLRRVQLDISAGRATFLVGKDTAPKRKAVRGPQRGGLWLWRCPARHLWSAHRTPGRSWRWAPPGTHCEVSLAYSKVSLFSGRQALESKVKAPMGQLWTQTCLTTCHNEAAQTSNSVDRTNSYGALTPPAHAL